jgi:hypothetical protein
MQFMREAQQTAGKIIRQSSWLTAYENYSIVRTSSLGKK